MAVENIIDAFYNACGRGDLATVQRYFSADNTELNGQGMYWAISEQHIDVVAFLLPYMQRPLTGTFHRKVVDTNNTKLFEMFYNAELDDKKQRWLELGIVTAAHFNRRAIIDHCFERVYTPQWWDIIRYTFLGGKVGHMQLGFEYLEEKVKTVQQREMLEQVVGEYGRVQARKL